MILTEQDAMTKRCQESFAARVTTDGGGSIYRPLPNAGRGVEFQEISAGPRNCLGAACMAWRWSGWRDQSGTIFANSTNRSGVEHVGYCGKAGAP